MKKIKFLWALILIPLFLIAADIPNLNLDWQSSECASTGNAYKPYNGDQGCPYVYDFSFLINSDCSMSDVDLDNST
jgi:hypothetical protein